MRTVVHHPVLEVLTGGPAERAYPRTDGRAGGGAGSPGAAPPEPPRLSPATAYRAGRIRCQFAVEPVPGS